MEKMETKNWKSLHVFGKVVNGNDVTFVDSPLDSPDGVDETVRANWDSQLRRKKDDLTNKGTYAEIRPYVESGTSSPLNALYKGSKPVMWPGTVISLKKVRESGSGIGLAVGQTSFPFISAISDPEISDLYTKQGIPIPRPALAICTYAITTDGKIVLTQRGPKTNMYPGRMYGQGGNPETTSISVIDHQKDEMQDEILVGSDDYDSGNFEFGGIVEDNEGLPRKPDLIGWIPINLSSEDVEKRIYSRAEEDRPNDAVGVVFAPSDKNGLFKYLTEETNPVDFCPPAHAGLVVYGAHKFGRDWADKVIKKMNC
jgi:hypothetical protein